MIPDWDTDCLFVSDQLERKYPALFSCLRAALEDVPIEIVPGTHDIWCRDFMPIQLSENAFCQFSYQPDYLRNDPELVTPPEKCRLAFMRDYRQKPIVLDGGNIVASRTKVILTDKVYKENPTIERPRLRDRLEAIFQAECVFIPKEPFDEVGHSDGVVRFIAENRVLMSDYSAVDPGYGDKVRRILEKNGLEVETLPMFQEKGWRRPGELPSAVGNYVNFLRVGESVILPGYDRPEDQLALERVRQVLPNVVASQVPCRELAEEGGVLNCVSWTIKMGAVVPQVIRNNPSHP
jgi:agmatine deiminase